MGRKVKSMASYVVTASACMAILLLSAPHAQGLAPVDLDNCNSTHPCCINADEVTGKIGSATKSFCHIEYPLRAEEAFGTALARKKNRDAYLRHKELVEEGKCNYEACKGFVCAESFPRCFYINDKQQGEFRFETCLQTCEECYSSCKPEAALKMKYDVSQCSGNPSQYTIACTSDASSLPIHSTSMILHVFTVFGCLFLAVA